MDDPWLTVKDVSERLSYHVDTVRKLLVAGKLRGYRVSRRGGWRVRASEVDRFVMGDGTGATPAPGAARDGHDGGDGAE